MLQPSRTVQSNSKFQVILSSVSLIILAMVLASLAGCDPVRTIRHSVTMEVTDDRGVSAPDVKVSMKESWESYQTWGGGTPESEKSYFRQQWKSMRWLEGVTNAQGKAVIWKEVAALDWNKGSEPPATRDHVSNREFIIKLDGQNVQDEIYVVMKPGAVVTGKRYTVKIEDIAKPKYVPVPSGSTSSSPTRGPVGAILPTLLGLVLLAGLLVLIRGRYPD